MGGEPCLAFEEREDKKKLKCRLLHQLVVYLSSGQSIAEDDVSGVWWGSLTQTHTLAHTLAPPPGAHTLPNQSSLCWPPTPPPCVSSSSPSSSPPSSPTPMDSSSMLSGTSFGRSPTHSSDRAACSEGATSRTTGHLGLRPPATRSSSPATADATLTPGPASYAFPTDFSAKTVSRKYWKSGRQVDFPLCPPLVVVVVPLALGCHRRPDAAAAAHHF